MSQQIEKYQPGEILLVLVSCPADKLDDISIDLIESGLASCINVVPGVKSFYHWQGKLQQDKESLMLIKCPANNYKRLESRILDLHPYELPEILTVSVSGGLQAYLDWVLHPDKKHKE
jgi:periplasmic divalent cation tolerance protein